MNDLGLAVLSRARHCGSRCLFALLPCTMLAPTCPHVATRMRHSTTRGTHHRPRTVFASGSAKWASRSPPRADAAATTDAMVCGFGLLEQFTVHSRRGQQPLVLVIARRYRALACRGDRANLDSPHQL